MANQNKSQIRSTVLDNLDAEATFSSIGNDSVHLKITDDQIGQFYALVRREGWGFDATRLGDEIFVADIYTDDTGQAETEVQSDPLGLESD